MWTCTSTLHTQYAHHRQPLTVYTDNLDQELCYQQCNRYIKPLFHLRSGPLKVICSGFCLFWCTALYDIDSFLLLPNRLTLPTPPVHFFSFEFLTVKFKIKSLKLSKFSKLKIIKTPKLPVYYTTKLAICQKYCQMLHILDVSNWHLSPRSTGGTRRSILCKFVYLKNKFFLNYQTL